MYFYALFISLMNYEALIWVNYPTIFVK